MIVLWRMSNSIHKKAMEIVKMLIDSGLSIDDQLIVLKQVREKVQFCKITGHEIKQKQLSLNP